MNLYQKIITLYPNLKDEDFIDIIILQNDSDGHGNYIKEWNHPTYAQPTQEQLDALENVPYTPILTETNYADAIQSHIDATAQSKQYADGISLASYDSSTNPAWASEAQTFIAWRDAVWAYAFTELDKVKNGTRPQPSIEEFISELPQISW